MTSPAAPQPLPPCDLEAAVGLWAEYAAAHPGNVEACAEYVVQRFGDGARIADDLLALIVGGRKRATVGLVADYIREDEQLPRVGGHLVACDSAGVPQVVLRTTELRLGPFSSVDADFAYDEGENDRTLEGWLAAHRRYFDRVSAAQGVTWNESDETVFERFTVVWPPHLAD